MTQELLEYLDNGLKFADTGLPITVYDFFFVNLYPRPFWDVIYYYNHNIFYNNKENT